MSGVCDTLPTSLMMQYGAYRILIFICLFRMNGSFPDPLCRDLRPFKERHRLTPVRAAMP